MAESMSDSAFVSKRVMQHQLFSELSDMFGREVPMYDRALRINASCNRAVCDVLGLMYEGFSITDEQIELTSGERHGAIRIGRPDEYRWICRFFACFAMEPHNFYDMTSIGAKSQPIIASAFRSTVRPDHRVFSSLLQTSYFDPAMRERIEALLAKREVFTDKAKQLIEKSEREGGLAQSDADALVREGVEHIFKWKGVARDPELYRELCDTGFKIAADIACFTTHHLNHLTPNTLCMDLYTAAMRRCLGEIDDARFTELATRALTAMNAWMDPHAMALHFKHAPSDQFAGYRCQRVEPGEIQQRVADLLGTLKQDDHDLSRLNHNGFKDHTEGPDAGTMVLLRQDAYKALTEPVIFSRDDGSNETIDHTARFGEIEQRYYATTPVGRELYDQCLARVTQQLADEPDLPRSNPDAFAAKRSQAFEAFPRELDALLDRGLVYGLYAPTESGKANAGSTGTTDLRQLVEQGHARVEGLRYEDFLPISAAGIFASNLNQYGTASTAKARPEYTQQLIEEIMGRPVIDTNLVYSGMEARSILETYKALGLIDTLDAHARAGLESRVSLAQETVSPESRVELAQG